jgi:hypothetical protein
MFATPFRKRGWVARTTEGGAVRLSQGYVLLGISYLLMAIVTALTHHGKFTQRLGRRITFVVPHFLALMLLEAPASGVGKSGGSDIFTVKSPLDRPVRQASVTPANAFPPVLWLTTDSPYIHQRMPISVKIPESEIGVGN